MLRHYLEIKTQYPDAVLLYRMGDFYEVFFDDAIKIAPILQITLTARHKGGPNEVPMCGVPHHALQNHLARLIKAGLKAVICDQVEDPAEAKGLVKREVVGVVTPGTASQPGILESKEENLLASLVWSTAGPPNKRHGAGAFLDVSTASFFVRRWADVSAALEDLAVLRPQEALFEPGVLPDEVLAWLEGEGLCKTAVEDDLLLDRQRADELLCHQFGTQTLRGFGLEPKELAVVAAATALAYAHQTQQSELPHIRGLTVRKTGETVTLDKTTLANLEIFRNQREGTQKMTLLSVVDQTVTPAGGRLLRRWLQAPLAQPDAIQRRHDAVEELLSDNPRRETLRSDLELLGDPERLLTRAVLGALTPREAATLRDGLRRVPDILQALTACQAEILREITAVDPLNDLLTDLEQMLVEEPPATFKDGGVIAAEVDDELDEVRSLANDSKQHILQLESEEREKTGINSLKIRYNKVFGYYLEVSKLNQHLVPEHYIRKQTLVNAERYITPEVKELEEKILGAEERQLELEQYYFEGLRERIVAAGKPLTVLAQALARLDVLAAFADLAARRSYRRPVIRSAGQITIREGRHPVVESLSSEPFVPNDVELGEDAAIVVLTGPNMGGKSTYLRQVALIVLLAQTGSFVPAESAEIGVVDRIFTRVGASDDLARGESTFMVEMIETANILHHATSESLVILDEVGRGTATFDGLSLAWAIVEHLHEHQRPKTLFATHYHELTELAGMLPGVINRTLAVKEWQDQILFLKRVIAGSADKSYGIHVAKLAGLPEKVLSRAAEILANLEANEYDLSGKPRLAQGNEAPAIEDDPAQQLALFSPPEEVVAKIILDTEVNELTPLAALNLLHSLKTRLNG